MLLEGGEDPLTFEGAALISKSRRGAHRAWLADMLGRSLQRQMLGLDLRTGSEHRGAVNDVAQLPHISRPGVGLKGLDRVRTQDQRALEAAQEGFRQRLDVLP